jgi:hypothetical protein
LDELKSAQVLIEVLRAEVNANIASEYVMQNSTINIHVVNQGDASENRWTKVITGHHKSMRRNVVHQANKSKSQITLL